MSGADYDLDAPPPPPLPPKSTQDADFGLAPADERRSTYQTTADQYAQQASAAGTPGLQAYGRISDQHILTGYNGEISADPSPQIC